MKALLASGLAWSALGIGSLLELPEKVEAWLFNPRERTERGLEAADAGDLEGASDAYDAAARLAPDDPVTRFNAGTGRLLAERGDAAEELSRAVELAAPEMLPRALYNLGNAQLREEDAAAAVESFKSSLRADPDQLDAKHNLELALRMLEEQNSGRGEDQETPDAENEGEQEQSPSEGSEDPRDEPQQDEGQEPRSQDGDGQQTPQPDQRDRPLPNFEDQEDMTAEQAAAILEAVENLEREQRREQAAERLKARKTGERDW